MAEDGTLHTSALTARVLALNETVTMDISAVVAPHTVWFSYTPEADQVMVSLLARASAGNAYQPRVDLFNSPAAAPVADTINPSPSRDQMSQLVVTPGAPKFFQIQAGFGSSEPPAANLILEVSQPPVAAVGAGTLLINDDAPGFPGLFLSKDTQEVLRIKQLTNGEQGVVAPNGIFALTNEDSDDPDIRLYIYDLNAEEIASPILASVNQANIVADNEKFYYSRSLGRLRSFYFNGTAGPEWTTAVTPFAMAVNREGTILYIPDTNDVRRHDLVNDVALATFNNIGPSSTVENDAFCLPDGSFIICWTTAANTYSIRRYDADGNLLNTYPVSYSAGVDGTRTDGPRMALGNDDTWFVVWSSFINFPGAGDTTNRRSRMIRIDIETGAILSDNYVPVFETGLYGSSGSGGISGNFNHAADDFPGKFGNSKSCPILVMRGIVSLPPDPNAPTWKLIGVDLAYQRLKGLRRSDP